MHALILFPTPREPGQPKVTLSVSSEPGAVAAEVRVDLASALAELNKALAKQTPKP